VLLGKVVAASNWFSRGNSSTAASKDVPKITLGGELSWLVDPKNLNLNNVDDEWTRCAHASVLGDVCTTLFMHEQNLTAGIQFSVGNHTFYHKEVDGGKYCLTHEALMLLAQTIPGLVNHKALVDEILTVEKYFHAEVFSLCVQIQEFAVYPAHACVEFNAHVLCYNGSCVYKGSPSFGCVAKVVEKHEP